jgi:drug/metabolite transporter (DMT)-like permease
MVFVGGSTAVSGLLYGAPLLTAQAVRYAVACLLLVGLAHAGRHHLVAPRGAEWLWLLGVAGTGMVLFNIALVRGSRHAEPAVLGVAVACVPLVLAVLGPLLGDAGAGKPSRRLLAAALVVSAGAAMVQGLGRCDGVGLAWAVTVFCCEAGFTLLAVPVLRRHGPWGVSVHTTWLAAAAFAVLALVGEGPAAALRLSGRDLLAAGYLAFGVTAIAFVLWYSCVDRIGPGRAGLLTGVAPIAAAAAGVAVGNPVPGPPVWLGVGAVAAGLALGLRRSPAPGSGGGTAPGRRAVGWARGHRRARTQAGADPAADRGGVGQGAAEVPCPGDRVRGAVAG